MAISTSIILRIEIESERISFGEVAAAIHQAGGDEVAIDVISSGKSRSTLQSIRIRSGLAAACRTSLPAPTYLSAYRDRAF